MKKVLVLTALTAAVVLLQGGEGNLELGQGASKEPFEPDRDSAGTTGVLPLELKAPVPSLQLAVIDGQTSGEQPVESNTGRGFYLFEPGGQPNRAQDEIPIVVDPDQVRWESREAENHVLMEPVTGPISLLGSTAGGGVTADERFGSLHGWKSFQGLDSVPDHEVAAGLSLPVGRAARLGLVYRYIQAEAQWGTDRYWGGGATPIRVEDTQNHGVVLLFRSRF
jgi:hypothetical protein